MKRPRIFKPRTGIRFNRGRTNGPDAGFIGSDIQVVTLTGSVERSLTQTNGTYQYPTVPFAGYPTNSYELTLLTFGSGSWVGGYLLDEYSGDAANSFNVNLPLGGYGDITYRDVGPRGPADDYAMGFSTDGVTPMLTGTIGQYALTSGSDMAILWAGRQSSVANPGFVFSSTGSSGIGGGGWSLNAASLVDDLVSYDLKLNPDGVYTSPSTFLFHYFPFQDWYLGLLTWSRTAGSASLACYSISSRSGSVSRANITGVTGTLNGTTQTFRVGSMADPGFLVQGAAELAMSGLFISSGSNAAKGFIGNELEILRSFATCMMARDDFRFSGSIDIDRSLGSHGTWQETEYVRQHLLGLGTASLGRSRGVTTVTTGSIPSWTNAHIRNSAFVLTALTSSDHEVHAYNTFRSGSEALEESPVPASASMYYSKDGKYRHVIVKKTASVLDLTRLPTTADGFTPVYYVPGKGTDISTVTGTLSYFDSTQYTTQGSSVVVPCVIPIDVPYSGKIVDVKVWVELMQTSGTAAYAGWYPLSGLGIALRSPNVSGFHAHAIRNDEDLKKVFTSNLPEFTVYAANNNVGRSLFGPDFITPFYRDTFILWEPSVFGTLASGPWGDDNHLYSSKYPGWQRDRSMRTVFSDGSPVKNPRHHVGASPSASYNGAPNTYFGYNSAYGFDVPWTSETEISGAGTYVLDGSPPSGWLTGPGGTAGTMEWPTTGVNYGTDTLQPFYPLLDPIFQRKRYDDPSVLRLTTTGSALFDPDEWTGFRPGLRGTEVSGTWHLVLVDHRYTITDATDLTVAYTPTYFRQVRLEFTLVSSSYDVSARRQDSKVRARRVKTPVLIHSVSGSDWASWNSGVIITGSWDAHVSDNYLMTTDDEAEIGRTIGIGILTGSAEATADFALLYRLTGTLADLSGSGPGWLLNNEFGVPRIPISSASLAPVEVQQIVSIQPKDMLVVRPILDGARRLSDAARDATPTQTLLAQYAAAISGTSI